MASWKEGLEENAILAVQNLAESAFPDDDPCREISVSPATNRGDNYLGIVLRFTLSNARRRWTFVLKACPTFDRRIPVDLMFAKERFAYTEMLPRFARMEIDRGVSEEEGRFKYAACLASDMTPTKEFVAFEDLKAENFAMVDRKESLAHDQMALLIRSLAHLHAFSFAMKRHEPATFARYVDFVKTENCFEQRFEQVLERACEKALKVLSDDSVAKGKLSEFALIMRAKMRTIVECDSGRPYSVMCHGDCWTNNFMFRCENGVPVEVRLLDWQVVRYASPVTDLAYLFFTSTDERFRSDHYDAMLKAYYEYLGFYLNRLDCDVGECYPADVYRKHIKEFMSYGLMTAIVTLPMFICDDDDIIDMKDLLTKAKNNDGEYFELKNKGSQDRYKERIVGMVNDFIKYELF